VWALGYPEQARLVSERAFQNAGELKHVYTSAHVCTYAGAQLSHFLRDPVATRDHATSIISLSDQHMLPNWRAPGKALLGWALGQVGRQVDAIGLVQEGLASLDASGAVGHRLQYVRFLAELHAQLGDPLLSLRLIEDAHQQMQHGEHHLWHAELCRIEGEIRRQTGEIDVDVEACFANAIEWARQQQAKSFELRAAMSMARLWRDRGRRDDARDLLVPIYTWFTEGFNTPDLQDARTLLGELGPVPEAKML
jgi:predicted ATPase